MVNTMYNVRDKHPVKQELIDLRSDKENPEQVRIARRAIRYIEDLEHRLMDIQAVIDRPQEKG